VSLRTTFDFESEEQRADFKDDCARSGLKMGEVVVELQKVFHEDTKLREIIQKRIEKKKGKVKSDR